MDLRAIAKREQRERDGVWMKLVTGADAENDPGEVLVSGLESPKYTQTLYIRMMPLRAKYGKDAVPPAEMDPLISEVMAECLLIDWRGITLDGKPLPYSKETAKKWLCESMHFRDMVSAAALRASRLLHQQYTSDVADLKKASAPVSKQQPTARKSRG
jgi:hypothetical protein